MVGESWLPIGFELPDGARCGVLLHGGTDWQILKTQSGGVALVAQATLANRWAEAGLIGRGDMQGFSFGSAKLQAVSCDASQRLEPVADGRALADERAAMAFAEALRATRRMDLHSPLQDALYVEALSRLLPTYQAGARLEDDVVLGCWLTGGAQVSARSLHGLERTLSWMKPEQLREVVAAAGFDADDEVSAVAAASNEDLQAFRRETQEAAAKPEDDGAAERSNAMPTVPFELAGRPELEEFFNEHVVDIVRHKARYAALGIGFPSAVILHGPPGCGKTFAVQQLVDYLGWPSFEIDASSVASAYIHETSKKVAEMFKKAMRKAPSVLVIDEMEAFLADRQAGSASSHHRVEEVAEFLRRIPEAVKNEVLIIAMTNRIEMIDDAILRRGRFDHVIKVDYASAEEIHAMLDKLMLALPKDKTVDTASLARKLAGRPLSDVSFVVREGARLAARAGEQQLTQGFLLAALESTPSRSEDGPSRRIGFL